MNYKLPLLFLILLCFEPVTEAADIHLPEMGDSAGSIVSPQQEYEIGQNFYWQLQQTTPLIEDPEITNYIQSLGERLVASSAEPSRKYTFFVVKSSQINAFAVPGGFIGVNVGLILDTTSEDELASVMSHEIGHITQRHMLRNIEYSKHMSIPSIAALLGSVLLAAFDPGAGIAAVTATQAGLAQSQLNFTRSDEAEADAAGIRTLHLAGFDPKAMAGFFKKLQQSTRFDGDYIPEFLRTHPVTESRIAEASARAAKYKRIRVSFHDALLYYLIKQKLIVEESNNVDFLLKHYRSLLAKSSRKNRDAIVYGYVLALLKNGQYIAAKKALQPLLKKEPERLSYQLALADIDVAAGNVKSALAIYDKNQKIYPNDEVLTLKEVDVLLTYTNNARKATRLLRIQLDSGEKSQLFYKLMAQATSKSGQRSESHAWLAEYYYSLGQFYPAEKQLKLAESYVGNDVYQKQKIQARLKQIRHEAGMDGKDKDDPNAGN